MSNEKKKQIVFIEPKPTVYNYRIAISLKKKYKTILVSFSDVNKEFYGKAYDEIHILELSHKLKFKSLISLSKKILNKEIKNFFNKIEKMKPYFFQITGPDLFSLMAILLLKKNPSPKILYFNDLWSADTRNFFFTKKFWIKGEVQKFCEKMCFKRADGALNKTSITEYDLFNYEVNIPKMALPPACLDEWIFPPKKKKNKEIHLCYAGSPNPVGGETISFMEVIKTLSSQEIYFHTYGPCPNEKDDQIFENESRTNKYYFKHGRVSPHRLNEEMSRCNYGLFPEFFEQTKVDSNPTLTTTQLASKMMSYLESGLPIILNKQQEYMASIIKKHNLGFEIDVGDLKNLRKIIEQKNYSQFQKSIKKFQKEFRLSKKIKDLEEFYEKIVKLTKKK